jgi:hypothetical protein
MHEIQPEKKLVWNSVGRIGRRKWEVNIKIKLKN